MLETLFLLLIAASWLYWLVAWWMVRVFFGSRPDLNSGFAPPVSILKPIRGLDAQAYQNFASYCQQSYPDFELLFGVADSDDPAVSIVKQLQKDFANCNIRWVLCPTIGSNRKASILHHLATQARHEVLVINDSDIRVTPDYLRRVVAPLANEHTGLVTCPYRAEVPLSLAAQLEALHIGVAFLPSVVVANRLLNFQFAMGSTVVVRRRDLARLGGFEPIANHLADDYQLGARVASLGLQVHLSDYIVSTILGTTTFREQWHRELRWARCARVSRSWEYPGLLLTFPVPLSLTFLLISGFAPLGWQVLAVSLLLRWLVAWCVTAYTGDWETRQSLLWLPVRDILSVLVWCAGALGRHVVWRGERFILRADGRMEPHPPTARNWLTVLRAWRL